ncbi:hypothetical protein [Dactylosporangium sp. NPDC000521]|uniref:hypothetical protein n=1 Tax=Dactylosporangium sp. NPDC000521 TaxID=3363975 RepID=UPI00368C71EC
MDRETFGQLCELVAQDPDVPETLLLSDDLDQLASILAVLDPGARDFGTDAAVLVPACVALRLRAPVLAVTVEPTSVGESRDGGVLLLVHQGPVTLASARIASDRFTGAGARAAGQVLDVVADLVNTMSATMTAATTGTGSRWPRRQSNRTLRGIASGGGGTGTARCAATGAVEARQHVLARLGQTAASVLEHRNAAPLPAALRRSGMPDSTVSILHTASSATTGGGR